LKEKGLKIDRGWEFDKKAGFSFFIGHSENWGFEVSFRTRSPLFIAYVEEERAGDFESVLNGLNLEPYQREVEEQGDYKYYSFKSLHQIVSKYEKVLEVFQKTLT